jgi:ubiquinone/menaquinone biosynthesis C-methylase UbiE
MANHELFDQWTTYEKVVMNNYMHHEMYFARLIDHLAHRINKPLEILDLGCGDAKPVLPLLTAFDIERYIGIDESAEALQRAGQVLEKIGVAHQLIPSSMEQARVDGEFDLIVASYSLHHLESPAKQRMLEWCLARLASQGTMAVIDVFMEPDEQREQYLDRWEQNTRSDWGLLSETEVSELIDHVRSSDLPERLSDYERLAGNAGFRGVDELAYGPDRLNKIIILEA